MNYRILNSKIDTCVNGKLDCKETLTVLVNGDYKVSPSVWCIPRREGGERRKCGPTALGSVHDPLQPGCSASMAHSGGSTLHVRKQSRREVCFPAQLWLPCVTVPGAALGADRTAHVLCQQTLLPVGGCLGQICGLSVLTLRFYVLSKSLRDKYIGM